MTKTEMCDKFADMHLWEYVAYTFEHPADENLKMYAQTRRHGYRIAATNLGLDSKKIDTLMWQKVYKWQADNGLIKQGV